MHIMYFTERAYIYAPEDEVFKLQSFFGVPNKHFDLIDLDPLGMDNPSSVFLPTEEPHGRIEATLRKD